MLALVVTAAVSLPIGYLIGRARLYARLGDWADWQLRFHLDRWTSLPRQAALFTLLLLTDTRRTVHAWRHRKDPPLRRSPAPTFDPDWAAKRRAAQANDQEA